MWRRLPARRLASALFSSSLPRAADATRPLERCLLPAATCILPPRRLLLWGRQLPPSRFASSVAEAVSSEDLDELNHANEEVVHADPNQQPPPPMPVGTTGEAGRGRKRRNRRGRLASETAAEHGMTFHKYTALRRRQIRIETEAWEQAAKEYRELLADMCEQKLAPNLPYVKSLFLGWFEPLRDQIIAEQELVAEPGSRASHRPYFNMLPADMMAVITMHKLMGLLMTGNSDGSVRVIQAACQIGEAIEHEVRIHKFLEKTKKSNKEIDNEEEIVDSYIAKEHQRIRKKVNDLMRKGKIRILRNIVKNYDSSRPWGQDAQAKVGSRLIELFIETAHIQPPASQSFDGPPDIRPAFRHEMRTVPKEQQKHSRRYGVIKCDPLVRQGLDRTSPLPEKPDTEDEAELKKWKWRLRAAKKENSERHSQRCDVELKLAVARKMKDEEGFYYPHNLDFRGRAYPMHPYLNHLGSDLCRGVLEFAEGRPLGETGLRWLKIHLANLYAGGVDKLSYDGRIAFTENHLEEIFDSADRPLEGKRWWLKAEDPFQCLAVCMNLAEALRSSSPETTISHIPVHQDGSCNGLQHYAALGRDKLGALAVNLVAGDKPADVYSEIANRVVEIMRRDAQKDPSTDPDAARARRILNQVDRKLVKQTVMTSVYGVTYVGAREQIKRRLKERGVIGEDAELFGAACYAAKVEVLTSESIYFYYLVPSKRGNEPEIELPIDRCASVQPLPSRRAGAQALYNGAGRGGGRGRRSGQRHGEGRELAVPWRGRKKMRPALTAVIATENEPVKWTTPLGLPVVQPYRKLGRHLIKTSLQVLTLQRETDKVMVKRQRTAFPPNFVHSLDGSHMMMTAVACRRQGLNFAGVHDSYWTHACDVDTMNKILREKFVELYDTPILENLLESFETSFPTVKFPPLPERGDFDLKDVLESPYFFN
ncbi:hypothetical protein PR202_gb29163 [Eleusine coracana subsp. coracana]|uniref:DNA-directed RNA polymerase n=1 Tax=Eleusine coracana subsp. coracana TaxID=191504 RepID=A0AAV5FZL5_ELECO|nr:hypothetical protein PR202_gb29163 [Eleusine coracana subsp. coracana]